MRRLAIALAGLLSCPFLLAAQPPAAGDSTPLGMPRWHFGVAADIGQPLGAFKENVSNAAGVEAHLLLRLDRHGLASLRVQGGWLNYGHESQRSCLGNTTGCRVAVNVTTANGIFTVAAGPQFALPLGPFRAYGYGLLGVSRFATVSGLGGGLLPDFVAADENYGDAGLLWSGGVGLTLPVLRSSSIDVGVAFQGHGRRNYLLKGGVTDNPDGSLAFDVQRSNANLLAIRIGASTALPWGRRRATP